MNIHEFQAKNLLAKYQIAVPPFGVAMSAREALRVVRELGLVEGVVKVQIHAGGRGKAGGVRFAKNPDEIVLLATELIGKRIVTGQTGPGGVVAEKVLISPPVSIEKEYYLAAAIDRSMALPIIMASPEGGMDIEEIAKEKPEKLLKVPIQLDGKMRSYHLLEICKFMGWKGDLFKEGSAIISNLAKLFIETDASLVEINPLVLTKEGRLEALDAKFSVDDDALFRQPAIAQWYDPSQETPNEVMARKFDLAYIGLDGEIGCLVNGAGLAMATMDIIHHYGGSPANFLDVGGGATKEQVAHGFKIILLDPNVKAILVNIFGGIMDCGVLAQGIIEAAENDQVPVPLIVRMEGTNVEVGKRLLKESGLKIITADSMADGAIKAVEAAKGVS